MQVIEENFNALLAANPDVDRGSIKHPYLKTVDTTVHRVDDEDEGKGPEEEADYSPTPARDKYRRPPATAGRKKTNPKKTPVREIVNKRKTPASPVVDESLLRTVSPTVTKSPPLKPPLQHSPVITLPEVKVVTPDLASNDTVAISKNDGMLMKV